eukprot:SAG11_NODE_1987_length_3961_cov_3.562662_3_plen_185_part_00
MRKHTQFLSMALAFSRIVRAPPTLFLPSTGAGHCVVAPAGDPPGGGTKSCEQLCNSPIDFPTPKSGKELVLKFASGLKSASRFYTDSNGREMVKRVRNARGPSCESHIHLLKLLNHELALQAEGTGVFTDPAYIIGEPVAANYYPVNSLISLDDGTTEMAVVTDCTMGGTSMKDGEACNGPSSL